MVLALIVIGVVLVVGLALVAVGNVVLRLGPEPARQVFEQDESLSFVVEALADHVTAELSFEEVRRIMRLHLDYLHQQGVARSGGDLPDGEGPIVLDPDGGADYVLRRGAVVNFRPRRDHVLDVIAAQLAYFEAIGAMSEVEGPDLSIGPDVTARPATPPTRPAQPPQGSSPPADRS